MKPDFLKKNGARIGAETKASISIEDPNAHSPRTATSTAESEIKTGANEVKMQFAAAARPPTAPSLTPASLPANVSHATHSGICHRIFL